MAAPVHVADDDRWYRHIARQMRWIVPAACAVGGFPIIVGWPILGVAESFAIIAGTAFLSLTAIALVRVASRSELRLLTKLIAILSLAGVAALAFLVCVFFLDAFYWPSGTRVDGEYAITSYTADSMGHTSTIRALYFRGTRVADYLDWYVRHPTRPPLIVFATWDEDATRAGTYAFDGSSPRRLRIGPRSFSVERFEHLSPDGEKVVLQIEDVLYLVDFGQWRADRLGDPGKEPHRTRVRGWAPSGRRFAVVDYGRRSGSGPRQATLQEWDAYTLRPRIVGCMATDPDRSAWQDSDFGWQDEVLVIRADATRQINCAE